MLNFNAIGGLGFPSVSFQLRIASAHPRSLISSANILLQGVAKSRGLRPGRVAAMITEAGYSELLAAHRPAKPRNREELAEMTALLERLERLSRERSGPPLGCCGICRTSGGFGGRT